MPTRQAQPNTGHGLALIALLIVLPLLGGGWNSEWSNGWSTANSAPLYKWVDGEGRVHYSSSPPRTRNPNSYSELKQQDLNNDAHYRRRDAYTPVPFTQDQISKGRLLATLACRNQHQSKLSTAGGKKDYDNSQWASVRYYRDCLGELDPKTAIQLTKDPNRIVSKAQANPKACEQVKTEIIELALAYLQDGRINRQSNTIDIQACQQTP